MKNSMFAILGIVLLAFPIMAMAQEDLPEPKVAPGHWGYGLKRAWENVQIFFTRSHPAKAELHLRIARERLSEAKAIAESKPEKVKDLVEDYEEELEKVEEEVNKSMGIGKDVSQIVKEIENSRAKHIAVLQLVLNKVPEYAKEAIQKMIERSEQRLENIQERIQERQKEESGEQSGETERERDQNDTESPGESKQTGKGTLVMKIIDKPISGEMESVNVTISKVEVHKAGYGSEQDNEDENIGNVNWIIITEDENTYDLLQIKDVKEFLASKDLDVGKYTQIRLYVSDAKIVVSGEESNLEIMSKSIKLVNEFNIEEGMTTELLLDFDAEESLIQTGSGRYKLKPTIRVIDESTPVTTTTTEITTTTLEETTTTIPETTTTAETTTTVQDTTTTTEEETTTTEFTTTTTIEETTTTLPMETTTTV